MCSCDDHWTNDFGNWYSQISPESLFTVKKNQLFSSYFERTTCLVQNSRRTFYFFLCLKINKMLTSTVQPTGGSTTAFRWCWISNIARTAKIYSLWSGFATLYKHKHAYKEFVVGNWFRFHFQRGGLSVSIVSNQRKPKETKKRKTTTRQTIRSTRVCVCAAACTATEKSQWNHLARPNWWMWPILSSRCRRVRVSSTSTHKHKHTQH